MQSKPTHQYPDPCDEIHSTFPTLRELAEGRKDGLGTLAVSQNSTWIGRHSPLVRIHPQERIIDERLPMSSEEQQTGAST